MTSRLPRFATACRSPIGAFAFILALGLALPTLSAAQAVTREMVIGTWALKPGQGQEGSFIFRADSTLTAQFDAGAGTDFVGTARWHLVGDTVEMTEIQGGFPGAEPGSELQSQKVSVPLDDPVVSFENKKPILIGGMGIYERID